MRDPKLTFSDGWDAVLCKTPPKIGFSSGSWCEMEVFSLQISLPQEQKPIEIEKKAKISKTSKGTDRLKKNTSFQGQS